MLRVPQTCAASDTAAALTRCQRLTPTKQQAINGSALRHDNPHRGLPGACSPSNPPLIMPATHTLLIQSVPRVESRQPATPAEPPPPCLPPEALAPFGNLPPGRRAPPAAAAAGLPSSSRKRGGACEQSSTTQHVVDSVMPVHTSSLIRHTVRCCSTTMLHYGHEQGTTTLGTRHANLHKCFVVCACVVAQSLHSQALQRPCPQNTHRQARHEQRASLPLDDFWGLCQLPHVGYSQLLPNGHGPITHFC